MSIEIKQGKEVDPATMDPAHRIVSVVKPRDADVEGQGIRYQAVMCPYGDVTYAYVSTNEWNWYTCGVCGSSFQA